MKIGFICPTVLGHLNPMTALARHLQARNHEASAFSKTASRVKFFGRPITGKID